MSDQQQLDLSDQNINRHCQADPQLKQQMLSKGLITWLAGNWILTSKGRALLDLRARLISDGREKLNAFLDAKEGKK